MHLLKTRSMCLKALCHYIKCDRFLMSSLVKNSIKVGTGRTGTPNIHRWRNQGSYGGYSPPKQLFEVAKPPPPPMWADSVLLVASACMVLLRA